MQDSNTYLELYKERNRLRSLLKYSKIGMSPERYLELKDQLNSINEALKVDIKDYKPRILNPRNHNQIKL